MIVRPEHFAFDRDKQRQLDELAHRRNAKPGTERVSQRELGTDQPFFTEVHSFCFYCGEKLTVPAVVWHGNDGKHPGDSARNLASSEMRGATFRAD